MPRNFFSWSRRDGGGEQRGPLLLFLCTLGQRMGSIGKERVFTSIDDLGGGEC
jgi:hypothetical protein